MNAHTKRVELYERWLVDWMRHNWVECMYLAAGVVMMHGFLKAELVVRSKRVNTAMLPEIYSAYPLPSVPRASQAGKRCAAQRRFPVALEKGSAFSVVCDRLACHLLPMEMQLDKRLLSGQWC